MTIVLFVLLVCVPRCSMFNLDTADPRVFSGPANSYFGYSVSSVQNDQGLWLLVGAPQAESVYQRNVQNPGAVYRCHMNSPFNCSQLQFDTEGNALRRIQIVSKFRPGYKRVVTKPVKDGQMFGATLVSTSQQVLACAPLRQDDKSPWFRYVHGICLSMSNTLQPESVLAMLPLGYFPKKQVYPNATTHPDHHYRFAMGQLGFSAAISKTDGTVMLGVPGLNDGTGGAIFYEYKRLIFEPDIKSYPTGGLIGYAVGFGQFYGSQQSFVASAPRDEKVLLFHDLTVRPDVVRSEQFGSYFGAALCVLDADQDGQDELVVGAPLYRSSDYDEGRVFVYSNQAGTLRLTNTLVGSESAGARFGLAVSSLGDVNTDGYPDLAVGAPYEDGSRGCVYIFNCGRSADGGSHFLNNGMYTQRLCAQYIYTHLRGFGFAIHSLTSHGLGVAVGSYASSQTVLLDVLPVVTLYTKMVVAGSDNRVVHYDRASCEYAGRPRSCLLLYVRVTHSNTIPLLPGEVCLKLEADVLRQDHGLPVRGMLQAQDAISPTGDGTNLIKTVYGSIELNKYLRFLVVLNETITDLRTDMAFRMMATLCSQNSTRIILNKFENNTKQIQIPFRIDCISDTCSTDVSVHVTTDKSYMVYGYTGELTFNFTVTNTADNAYLTTVVLRMSQHLEFIGTHTHSRHLTCSFDSETRKTMAVRCSIGHPMRVNEQKTLSVRAKYKTEVSEEWPGVLTPIYMAANVTTDSEDTDPSNNWVNITIPVKYDAKLRIRGRAFPVEVFVEQRKKDEAVNQPSWRVVKHLYELINEGPGIYPPGHLHLHLPPGIASHRTWVTAKGEGGGGSEADCTLSASNHLTSACPEPPCTIYKCNTSQVSVGGSLILETELWVDNKQSHESRVMTTMKAFSEHIKDHPIFWVSTSVLLLNGPHRTPCWMLLMSVAVGCVVLSLLTIILAEFGFFKRRKREELLYLIELDAEDSERMYP